jgi:tetratricopeptide (TPR) repeat protein
VPDQLVDDVLGAAGEPGVVEPWFRLAAHVSRHRPVLVLVDDADESPAARALAAAGAAARSYADGAWMLVATGRAPVCAVTDARLSPEPLADGEAWRVLEHVLPLAPGEADRVWRSSARDLGRALGAVLTACAAGGVRPTRDGHMLPSLGTTVPPTPATSALAAVGGDVPLDLAAALLGDHAFGLADQERGGRLVLPLDAARRVWAAHRDEPRNTAATAQWRSLGDHRREGLAHAVAGRAAAAAAAWVLEGDGHLVADDRVAFLEASERLSALLPELEPQPSGVIAHLANRRRMLGHLEEAATLAQRAIDRSETAVDAWRAWLAQGHVHAHQSRFVEATAAWGRASVHARATGDPVRWIRCELRAASLTPDVARWDGLWAEMLEVAPSELPFAAHLRAQAFSASDPRRALGYLDAVPSANHRTTYRISVLNLRARIATQLGDDAGALAAHLECATLARRIGHPQYLVVVVNLAVWHVHARRDAAAREWTELGLTLALRLTPSPVMADLLRVVQAVLAARAGDSAAAAEVLAHVAPRLGPERWDAELLAEFARELASDAVAAPVATELLRRLSRTGE